MPERAFKRSYKETRRDNTGLNVYNSGRQQCGPGYAWGQGVRDHYLLHYISAGRGEYHCEGRSWELEAGWVFLAWPGVVIRYEADGADPWEYGWVGFQGADAPWLLGQTGFSRENPVLRVEDREAMEAHLDSIYGSRGWQPSHDAAMTGRLYLLLGHLMEIHPAEAGAASGGRGAYEQAVRYISQSVNPISVEEIAGAVGLSRSHLYRIFRRESGMSPVEFVNSYRINRACGLLREKGLTVAQAAASVGFEDPLYFSRVFRRLKGVSPGKYREGRGLAE